MEEKVCSERTLLLKKAKWAIRKSYWLNARLPVEYHSILVNMECCSLHCLRVCLQHCSLSPSAEMLLCDKYANDHPEILKEYIRAHDATEALLFKFIENKNLELLQYFIDLRRCRYYREDALLPPNVQIELINSEDATLFQEIIKSGIRLTAPAFEALLKCGNYDMLDFYCNFCLKKGTGSYLGDKWFNILFERHDIKSISLLSNFFRLSCANLIDLINANHDDFIMEYFRCSEISDDVQCHIAQNRKNKRLIALYLKNKPFVKKAQIELVKSGFKDLLKLHYLRYGLDNDTIIFLASLNNVKSYLGV